MELDDKLMLLLLNKKLSDVEEERVQAIIENEQLNWELFLGKVFFNRVNGLVYKNLLKYNSVPREVRMSLELNYYAQVERNNKQKNALKLVSKLFTENDIKHAFLKGSILNYFIYEDGMRISNDVDILVSNKDLNKITKLLEGEGYIQGEYNKKTGEIDAASKLKKMYVRANTHEVCSFAKLNECKFLNVNEIDINFKLSAVDTLETTELMLNNLNNVEIDGEKVYTLQWDWFFIQLASHLYREATAVRKIVYGSDMQLYKFYDFYQLINSENVKINWDNVVKISKETNQLKGIYYALYCINELFPNCIDSEVLKMAAPKDTSFVDQYVGKQNSDEIYTWEKPFLERVFDYKRKIEANKNIKEVAEKYNASIKGL